MPAGVDLQLNSTGLRPWSDTVRQASEWSSRDGATFFVDQCKEVAQELYQQTAAAAPTAQTIAAKVESLGWRVAKRGNPADWVAGGYFQALKDKVIKKKRGRNARGVNDAVESDYRAQKRSGAEMLALMQAYVIKKRVNAIKYLASGWLGALVDLGGSLRATSGDVDHARGGADIIRTGSGVTVSLWNRTPGIAEQEEKHGFIEKAVTVRLYDLAKYMNNAAAKLFRRAA